MPSTVDNQHITRIRPLISPAVLAEELALTDADQQQVGRYRRTIESILDGTDDRLMVIVGPCSIHDPSAALEYAKKLRATTEPLDDRLFVIMRVYFEKPRTVVGWKGLINDPYLNGSYQINQGLRLARKLLLDITRVGLPAGTEFLDTTFGQYYSDLISWGAIGARTTESQIHRELASGLSMPVGIKNRTDGNVQVAVDAIRSARQKHLFPSLTKEGAPAIFETEGNRYCHLILRGGDMSGPNFDRLSIEDALSKLAQHDLPKVLVVDCSHGNSAKEPSAQKEVVSSLVGSIQGGLVGVRGIMLESHLVAGRQDLTDDPLVYGQSITDACLGLEETVDLLGELHRGCS